MIANQHLRQTRLFGARTDKQIELRVLVEGWWERMKRQLRSFYLCLIRKHLDERVERLSW